MRWIVWLLAAVLMTGCAWGGADKPGEGPAKPAPIVQPKTPAETEKALGATAREVIGILKAKDMEKLPALVHPEKGLRFSPYAHVDVQKDIVLRAGDLKDAWVNKRTYTWGTHAGSGEPINLGFADYFSRWVYDVDFAAAPKLGWGEAVGKGTTVNNWKEAYPNGVMVEFHFPGFDSKLEGMDWRSLRLVFEAQGDRWYLVGIIHDQWTP